ncbi:transmembrane protein 39A-A-like [Branchiostoma floridae x Branchiostoma belcheri]
MPGGRRGLSRQQLSRSTIPVQSISPSQTATLRARNGGGHSPTSPPLAALITIIPIKHTPFPDIPMENNIVFESILLIYLLLALFLQYVNIYKTVWWMPFAATNTALNFYLIDIHLVVFICVILARRLVWKFFTEAFVSYGYNTVTFWIVQPIKVVLLLTLLGSLTWTLLPLYSNNSILNLLFLCYPFGIYLLLYGIGNDQMYLNNEDNQATQGFPHPQSTAKSNGESRHRDDSRAVSRDTSTLIKGHLWPDFPQHQCLLCPQSIRDEVEVMKADFNNRIKEILFNSMLCAYYVGFIPVCFVQKYLHYDVWWSCQHILFVWINTFVMLMAQYIPPSYCDTLHRCAMHLGKWQKVDGYTNTPQHTWTELTTWPCGVLIRHNRNLFKAVGPQNVAIPSDASHTRFYMLFSNPLCLLNCLALLELVVVCYQLFLLLFTVYKWDHILSVSLMLFVNYYVLFKLLRDRFILGKVYAASAEASQT